ADRNRSHWSTSKTPSYTKSVSWQHHPNAREKERRTEINNAPGAMPGFSSIYLLNTSPRL
ncbi:hypothetical protein QMN93_21835, partial [Enterobacter sp. R-1.6.2]|uniref:hypothetical protein n=1 Tax=unclassified Enterobacter TaxID=2608935 RepID=UPI002B2559C8